MYGWGGRAMLVLFVFCSLKIFEDYHTWGVHMSCCGEPDLLSYIYIHPTSPFHWLPITVCAGLCVIGLHHAHNNPSSATCCLRTSRACVRRFSTIVAAGSTSFTSPTPVPAKAVNLVKSSLSRACEYNSVLLFSSTPLPASLYDSLMIARPPYSGGQKPVPRRRS